LFRIAPGGATDLQIRKENGVTLGRPRSTPDDVVARIVRERAEGKTTAIARDLSKDAVPTAQGARVWSQATVRALLTRERRAHKGQTPDRPR
jgi:hypothetical protein